MTAITLVNLSKHFGATKAVDGVSLEIPSGSLFFLLGPSGCGKTTLLRMLAGFIPPTGGAITFGGRDVTNLPPNKRNTGMVFQSYALWPHMTVAENVAYGLKVRHVSGSERRKKVDTALRRVQMEQLAQRKPNELSGGQQQRVALARALVIEPTVLLLDEPLSNLDAKLRLEMRSQIRRICKQSGITTVYVTHDQKEALSMADGIAVMREGSVVQTGRPRDLYDRPNSRFVADFLGETNFLPAVVAGSDEKGVRLETAAGQLLSTAGLAATPEKGNVTCSLRPEALRMARPGESPTNALPGRRVETIYLGEVAQHLVEIDGGGQLRVLELNPAATNGQTGAGGDERVSLTVDPDEVVILTD